MLIQPLLWCSITATNSGADTRNQTNQSEGQVPFDRVCDQLTGQFDLVSNAWCWPQTPDQLPAIASRTAASVVALLLFFGISTSENAGGSVLPSGHFVVTTISTQIDWEAHSPAQ